MKKFAKEYLKNVKPWYYEGISTGTAESFALAKLKLGQLSNFLSYPKKIVSIGVGGGEEVCAAVELFCPLGASIYGLDISPEALTLTNIKLEKLKLAANLIEGDATNMPFEENSISAFIESSVMHEIYSYGDDGKDSWKRNIKEIATKLCDNGIFLLRDFAAPESTIDVQMFFKTEIAEGFYNYFRKYYRVFETWNKDMTLKIIMRRTKNDSFYPKIDSATKSVVLSQWKVRELMLHFRIFFDKFTKGLIDLDDPSWKEINEVYLPAHPDRDDAVPMSQDEYVAKVLNVSNSVLNNSGYKMICIQNTITNRQEAGDFFKKHFTLNSCTKITNEDEIYSKVTEKMELIFKKVKNNLLHD